MPQRHRNARSLPLAVAALLFGLGGVLVTATPAAAATLPVLNNSSDPGVANSLPWAIDQANADPSSVITFAAGLQPTLTLTADLPDITADITIAGPGSGLLTIEAPGSVFTAVGTSPGSIEVAISGLTLATTGGGDAGIDVSDGDLMAEDIVAGGFASAGVNVTDGSLSLTTARLDGNAVGLGFDGTDLLLRDVVASGNTFGIGALVTAGGADLAGITLDGNLFGLQLYTDGGTAAIRDAHATGNTSAGFMLSFSGGTIATMDASSATSNGGGFDFCISDAGSSLSASGLTAERNETVGMVASACADGTVTIADATIAHNGDTGLAIEAHAGGSVTVADTLVRENGTDPCGCAGSGISVIADEGTVSITGTSIQGNEGSRGGGIDVDLIDGPSSSVTVRSSTISGNSADVAGGGISVTRDLDSESDEVQFELLSSTVSGNRAPEGAGVLLVEEGTGAARLVTSIRHSTVAANTASAGTGGVRLEGGEQRLVLDHALIGDNGADLEATEPLDGLSARFTLVELGTLALPSGAGNIEGVDPRLGPLADNGGPTRTHMLLEGSPAFNAGDPAFAPPPGLDQRGEPRVFQVIDIGAVERRFALPATGIAPWAPGAVALALLASGLLLLRRRATA